MAEADQKQIGGFDNMMAQFENSLKGSKMLELAAELDVESYYDGRLFRVSGADGLAPLRSASTKLGADGKPDEILEMGSFWCYRNGAWYPLGD
jgi:hypothetical protein